MKLPPRLRRQVPRKRWGPTGWAQVRWVFGTWAQVRFGTVTDSRLLATFRCPRPPYGAEPGLSAGLLAVRPRARAGLWFHGFGATAYREVTHFPILLQMCY